MNLNDGDGSNEYIDFPNLDSNYYLVKQYSSWFPITWYIYLHLDWFKTFNTVFKASSYDSF